MVISVQEGLQMKKRFFRRTDYSGCCERQRVHTKPNAFRPALRLQRVVTERCTIGEDDARVGAVQEEHALALLENWASGHSRRSGAIDVYTTRCT